MVADLVQRLRTCSAEERRAVAMELARTGTDEAVQELIRMVEGGTHTPAKYGRKHWYSISKLCLEQDQWEYSLGDQLIAIEALGETKSQRALQYLQLLRVIEAGPERKSDAGHMIGSDCYLDNVSQTFYFPKAKGNLSNHLSYEIGDCEMNYLPASEGDHKREQSNIKGHVLINAAIVKLESTL